MARLIHGVAPTPSGRADPLANLTLLLNRLQRTILHADAERELRLKESEFEREKAQANINYARSLLTKLEQEALGVKIHARRHEAQADLVRKREVLDQLSERLADLAEFAAAADTGADDDSSDGEDILADIIATPSESLDSSRSPDMAPQEPREPSESAPAPLEPPSQPSAEQDTAPPPDDSPPATATHPPTTTSQTLRPRQPHPSPSQTTAPNPPPQASTTATSSSLFSDRPAAKETSDTTAATTAISTTEAILDHQRAEQDALSESILRLASELKASSHAFSASLEEDRELVERAGHSITRTGQQMEGVARRVGALQRMAEAEGWLGRMKLYALVYGLMVVLVVLVFALPKLRF